MSHLIARKGHVAHLSRSKGDTPVAKYAYHRLDANHQAIRDALEQMGATVDPRCPGDLLVGFEGRNYLLEVKTSKGKLKASQEAFQAGWRGQYAVVRSVDEALRVVAQVRA